MCLSTITESYEEPSPLVMSGLKIFKGKSSSLTFENQQYKNSSVVPLDQWIRAEEAEIGEGNIKYPAGFHVFEADSDSSKTGSYWNMKNARRVYMRNVHTKGKQDGITIYVAAEIYVPSDPNGWPPIEGINFNKPPQTPPEQKPAKKGALEKFKNKVLGTGGEA